MTGGNEGSAGRDKNGPGPENAFPEEFHGMTRLIDIDRDKNTGGEGYDYAVHRKTPVGKEATLERSRRGWNWLEVGKVAFRVESNRMELRIPRTLLGLPSNSPLDFEFKWTDNVPASGDILDFYLYGDVAPSGRFNYRYHVP